MADPTRYTHGADQETGSTTPATTTIDWLSRVESIAENDAEAYPDRQDA